MTHRVSGVIRAVVSASGMNSPGEIAPSAVSYTHLTLPTNREV